MSLINNAGEKNQHESDQRVNFESQKDSYIQNAAVDLAEANDDFTRFTDIHFEFEIRELVRAVFSNIDEYKVDEIAQKIYEKAWKIKDLEKKEKLVKKRYLSLESKFTNDINDEKVLEKFAKFIPKPVVNPNVVQDLLEGNFKRAIMGARRKLSRVVSLRSPSAYDLKTKANAEHSDDLTSEIAKQIALNQHLLQGSDGRRLELLKEMDSLEEQINQLLKAKLEAGERTRKLSRSLNVLVRQTEEIESTMKDFGNMQELMDIEEDQATGNALDKAAGQVYSIYRKLIWTDKKNSAYEKAFNDQASIERKLVHLESNLKQDLEVDDNHSSENKFQNCLSVYDTEKTRMFDFKNRQNRLRKNIENIKNLLLSTTCKYEKLKIETDQKTAFLRAKKVDHEVTLREIDRNENAWTRVETFNLEKLFWHEFGQRVAAIRELQTKLPKVGKKGPIKTTSLFYHFQGLKKDVELFEKTRKLNGLMEIMNRELGTSEFNPFRDEAEVNRLAKELEQIRRELAASKKKVIIPGLNAPVQPNKPVVEAKVDHDYVPGAKVGPGGVWIGVVGVTPALHVTVPETKLRDEIVDLMDAIPHEDKPVAPISEIESSTVQEVKSADQTASLVEENEDEEEPPIHVLDSDILLPEDEEGESPVSKTVGIEKQPDRAERTEDAIVQKPVPIRSVTKEYFDGHILPPPLPPKKTLIGMVPPPESSVAVVSAESHLLLKKVDLVDDWYEEVIPQSPLVSGEVTLRLIKLLGNKTLQEFQELFGDINMRAAFVYFLNGSLNSVRPMKTGQTLHLTAKDIHIMIGFYNDWLKPEILKGETIENLLNKIQSFDLPMTGVPFEWRRSKQRQDLANFSTEGVIDPKYFAYSEDPEVEYARFENQYRDYFKDVAEYVFADLNSVEIEKLRSELLNLKSKSVTDYNRFIVNLFEFKREIRFLCSGEFGGVMVNRIQKGAMQNRVECDILAYNPANNFEETIKLFLDSERLENLSEYLNEFTNKDVELLRNSIKEKLAKAFGGSSNVADLLLLCLI